MPAQLPDFSAHHFGPGDGIHSSQACPVGQRSIDPPSLQVAVVGLRQFRTQLIGEIPKRRIMSVLGMNKTRGTEDIFGLRFPAHQAYTAVGITQFFRPLG
jgi:hypothetical protein